MLKVNSFWDVLEIICIGLIFGLIPFGLFISNEIIVYVLSIVTRLIGIFIILYIIKTRKIDNLNYSEKPINVAWYIPFLLVCCSNFIVVLFSKNVEVEMIDYSTLFLKVILTIVIVIMEELLFRYILIKYLSQKRNKLAVIGISSLIFGLSHLLNISSLESLSTVFIQCGYSIFLGIILGFIYVNSTKIIYAMIVHFLFNFLNNDLVTQIFVLKWDITFYLVNIIIGIIAIAYILLLQKFIIKEVTVNVSKDMDI